MDDSNWVVLSEPEGKIYVIELSEGVTKIKGIGVIDTTATLGQLEIGDSVQFGNKSFTRVVPRLTELTRGMKRRAQTISAKDAGLFIGPHCDTHQS
jgi:tRNA A58 N-methylase Trm61